MRLLNNYIFSRSLACCFTWFSDKND